jgi:Lrp/AsnC family transcriptional regulator for asnA, asnC and gidA
MSKNTKKNTFLKLKPIKKFISGLGEDIKKYIGKDKACIIGLGDDGVFYAIGLYQWLQKTGKDVELTFMDSEGKDLEENKVMKRKVLIIDNDIITGKSYRRAMEVMRPKKKKLKIKDIKYAVMCDRIGQADFSIEGYPAPISWKLKDLDESDLGIIRALSKDGRKSFVKIAKASELTSAGVKNRVEKLIKNGILEIKGLINIEKFYEISASINIEGDSQSVSKLIEKLKNCPLIYQLNKVSGRHNLIISIVAPNPQRVEYFIDKQIRSEPGIKHIEVSIGGLPIIPKTIALPPFRRTKISPCGAECNKCEYKSNCDCCFLSVWYKG